MAEESSNHAHGRVLINTAKSISMSGLSEFKLNHEMSMDSNMFDEMTIIEMDSCGLYFQILNQNIAKVSNASGDWIDSIISLFGTDAFKQDKSISSNQIQAMSEKAQQITSAYQVIAISLGDTVTRLKEAYIVTNEGNKSLVESLKQSIADAEQDTDSGNKLELKGDEYNDAAEKDYIRKAKDLVLKDYYSSGSEGKITIIADNSAQIVIDIESLQTVMNDVAEFFTTQANLFMGATRALVENIDVFGASAEDNTVSLNSTTASWGEVKSTFTNYGANLYSIVDAFMFETNVKPDPTTDYQFQKLHLTLSLPYSEAVQEFMDTHVQN